MSRMQRNLPRPTLDAMVSPSSSTVSIPTVQSGTMQQGALATSASGTQQILPGASYMVSESGAHLTLGGAGTAYQVTSSGVKTMNNMTGSISRLGTNGADYHLTLAGTTTGTLSCTHVSELDIDGAIQIGRGSSGKVFNCLHIPSGVRVCVKQMQIDDSRHREEVKRELDSLHKSQSRFIVDFYGAFFHNDLGVILLVLELMEGSLHEILKLKGRLTEREGKAFALQVLHGLGFLHNDLHLIHRDIKPANLLFHRSGQVKITDFGVSSGQQSQDPSSVTTFVGSILYMSPERLEGKSYGAEADIWSLGITLCDAIGGCHPYQETEDDALTFWDLLQKVMKNDPELHQSPLKTSMRKRGVPNVDETVSDDLDSFVAECLAFDKSDRSCAEKLLLHPWLEGMTTEESEGIVREVATQVAILRQQQGMAVPPSNTGGSLADQGGLATSNMFDFSGAQPAQPSPPPKERGDALLNDLMSFNK